VAENIVIAAGASSGIGEAAGQVLAAQDALRS